jgi:hypothetical protein
MTPNRVVVGLLLAVAVLAPFAGAIAPAAAHMKGVAPMAPAAQAVTAAAEPPAAAWIVVLALAASLALAWRRPRHALALGLALVLSVFAFESGFHSVHHPDARNGATHCAVASAAAHTTGTVVAPVEVLLPSVLVARGTAPLDSHAPAARTLGAARGRAPPFLA